MAGKCPKCDSVISNFNIKQMNGQAPGNVWRSIACCCPSCGTILSVAIDPIAIKTDVVNEVVRKLKGRLS